MTMSSLLRLEALARQFVSIRASLLLFKKAGYLCLRAMEKFHRGNILVKRTG